jgi:hypothetical protein
MWFTLQLSRSDGQGEAVHRRIPRDTTGDATDAAIRWLRLVRRTAPEGMIAPDQWMVWTDNGTEHPVLIATGNASVPGSIVE